MIRNPPHPHITSFNKHLFEKTLQQTGSSRSAKLFTMVHQPHRWNPSTMPLELSLYPSEHVVPISKCQAIAKFPPLAPERCCCFLFHTAKPGDCCCFQFKIVQTCWMRLESIISTYTYTIIHVYVYIKIYQYKYMLAPPPRPIFLYASFPKDL